MKDNFLSKTLILFVSLLLSVGVYAHPVDVASARKVAVAFLQSAGLNSNDEDLVDISDRTPFWEFYTFTVNNGRGFILVAGDDNVEPILGYSFRNAFSPEAIPPHVMSWLKGYEDEIRYARTVGKRLGSADEQWKLLRAGKTIAKGGKATVGPFLTTTWNQSPYYNALCPYDSVNHDRAVCGCTATATAQIMKFFNYPASGYGQCTYTHRSMGDLSANYDVDYQWDSMPLALNANSTDGQISAVATLIYHIGVSVSMDYNARGSAGKTASYGYGGEPSSENAFKYNFKYSPYVWTAFRIDYDVDGWKNLMRQELDNGRPILYAGYDERQSGHAFVVDGYNNYGLYHLNWGWGGNYDGNFRITNLNPNDYNFNLFATATVGIEPYLDWDTVGLTTVRVSAEGVRGASAADGVVSGDGNYNFGDTIVMRASAANENTRFVGWSDGCRYNPRVTVATGGTVNFTALFAPVHCDTIRYFTCDNSMNRASNITPGLGADSVWGIKIPASSLHNHHNLSEVIFMGRKAGTHTLTIYTGTDHPESVAYTATFYDSLDYEYTFYSHKLSQPVIVDGSQSLWIMLKCTDVDTPGVFSIYGGNPNGLLVGEDLHPFDPEALFSWMIEGVFEWDGVGFDEVHGARLDAAVYPNPAEGIAYVRVLDVAQPTRIQVFDLNGHCVVDRPALAMSTPLEGLDSGLYVVKISSASGVVVKKLVIK